jgi:hypothetical protein
MPNGARQRQVSTIIAMFVLLRRIELDSLITSSQVCVKHYSNTRNERSMLEANLGFYLEEPPYIFFYMRYLIPDSQDAMERLQHLHVLYALARFMFQLHNDEMDARTQPSTAPYFVQGDKCQWFKRISFFEINLN